MQLANRQHNGTDVAFSSGARRTVSLAAAAVIWIATVAVAISFGGVTSRPGSTLAQPTTRTWVSDPAYVAIRSGERASLSATPGWVSDPALIEHRRGERESAAITGR